MIFQVLTCNSSSDRVFINNFRAFDPFDASKLDDISFWIDFFMASLIVYWTLYQVQALDVISSGLNASNESNARKYRNYQQKLLI
jgi:hypothetical protein